MPDRLAWFQLAEIMGIWDIDYLESVCPYSLLHEWQDYLLFAAKCRNGEIEADQITEISEHDLMMGLAGA